MNYDKPYSRRQERGMRTGKITQRTMQPPNSNKTRATNRTKPKKRKR